MTKRDVHYRLPQDCCATCKGSYRNSYGDVQCTELNSGLVVDAGGICDIYFRELNLPTGSDGTADNRSG